MENEILIINGHDYSRLIEAKGYGWTRNDLDASDSGRPKTGLMRRDKVGTKRKLTFKTMPAPRKTLAQLDKDLSQKFFQATYLDLHGVMTKTFYCTEFSTGMDTVEDDWTSASFNIIEQ
jgi:hypothetical protein